MAAVLKKNGYEVTVLDCPALNMTYDSLGQEILRFEPDIVGITSVTVTFASALQAARDIKQSYSKALVVFGGPHVTVLDEPILREQPEIDVIVRGEGEITLLELARLISESKLGDLGDVAGLTFRKDRRIVRTPDRPFIQNLDELPFPAYEFFQLDKYRRFGKLVLPIITSRGCAFRCSFCLAPHMAGKRFRARSPKNVVDELEWLNTYKPDAFTFHDETFTHNKKRVFEICEEMKRRNIHLPWDCSTRVDQISKELLAEMWSANCQHVSFGIESGSQKILDAMKKGVTVEQNAKAITWAKEVGITVSVSVILGYPGETPAMLQETLDFIRRTEPDDVLMSLATPYPGIELYDVIKSLGWKMSDGWSHCDMQTEGFDNPSLTVDLREMRRRFYDSFYSPGYVLRQSLKRNFYSRVMARSALNHLLWRTKLPVVVHTGFKKMMPQQSKA